MTAEAITKEILEKKLEGAPKKIPKEFQKSFLNILRKVDGFLKGIT